ncbi:Tricalbin-2 [Mitosporidium daphniae]|uniref:Lipid binding protein n=1 Tax=Mitosporidium daphniae TaxID=1485682 RepID=A0A098VTN0_9MICR|nr:lipid binding protein [Mitosporidium daphniae]KGG51081.1 lipid binding protein [Mitosporidium daphniae]|eukprot:XP_013237526.1 lipid binding protein [Mitosporidium daphniae]
MLHIPKEEKKQFLQKNLTPEEKKIRDKKVEELEELINAPPINPLAIQANKAVQKSGHAAKSMPTMIDKFEIPCLLIFYLIVTWLLGHYNFHFLWLVGTLSSMVVLYKRRVNRFAELELFALRREAAKNSISSHEESAEWINYIVGRIWGVYEPVLSATLIDTVNEALEDACPSFLSALKLTTFTLGSEPPVILGFRRYPDTPDDVIHFEIRLAFVPRRSTEDVMYPLRRGVAHRKWSSQIVLAARFGSSLVGVDVPILVENISVEVHARIQLKLMPAPPVVKIAQISLMSPPKVDFVLKPLKSLDIMDLPGLHSFINSMIDSVSSELAVTPNCITLNVDEIVNGAIISSQKPVGVLCIGIIGAKIPKTNEYMGTVDPFVRIIVNGIETAHTKELVDQQDPLWGETFWILLPNDKSQVSFRVIHASSLVSKEVPLGELKLDIQAILNDFKEKKEKGKNVESFYFTGWAPYFSLAPDKPSLVKGELKYSVAFFPTVSWISPEEKDLVEHTEGAGIIDIAFHQAIELTPKKSTHAKAMNLYAEGAIVPSHLFETSEDHSSKLKLDSFANIPSSAYFRTRTKKKTNSPIWSQKIKTFVKDASLSSLWIQIREERDFSGPSLVGELVLPLSDTLLQTDTTLDDDWFQLNKSSSGKVRITYTWDPITSLEDAESLELEAVGGESGSLSRTPSVGLAHLTVLEADGFSAANSIGSNFYVKAFLGGPKGSSGGTEPLISTRSISLSDTGGAPPRLIWLDGAWAFIKNMDGTFTFELFESGSKAFLSAAKGRSDGGSKSGDLLLASCSLKIEDVMNDPAVYLNHWLTLKTLESADYCRLRIELAYWPVLRPELPIMPTHSVGILRVKILRTSGFVDSGDPIRPSTLVNVMKLVGGSAASESVIEELISSGAKKLSSSSKQLEWKESFEWIVVDSQNSALSLSLNCVSKKAKKYTSRPDLGSVRIPIVDIISKQNSAAPAKKDNSAGVTTEIGEVWPFSTFDPNFFDPSSSVPGICLEINYRPLDIDYCKNASTTELLNELLSFVSSEEVPGYIVLRIQSAANLKAVDSGGTSDPFSLIKLNGIELGKTSVIKKSLNPEWNERFVLPVRSLRYSILGFEVFDWNRVDSIVHLGTISMPLLQMIFESTFKKNQPSGNAQAIYRDIAPDAVSDSMLADFTATLGDTTSGTIFLHVAFVENAAEFKGLTEHLDSSGGLMTSTKGFFKGVGSVFVGATATVAFAPMAGGKFLAKKGLGLFSRHGKHSSDAPATTNQVAFADNPVISKVNIQLKGLVFGKNVSDQAKEFYVKARGQGSILGKSQRQSIASTDSATESPIKDIPTTHFDLAIREGHNEPIVFYTKLLLNGDDEEENDDLVKAGPRFVFSPADITLAPEDKEAYVWLQDIDHSDSSDAGGTASSKERRAEASKSVYFETLLQKEDMFKKFKSNIITSRNLPESSKSTDASYLSLLISKIN